MKILAQLTKINSRGKKRVGRGIGSGKGSKSSRGITRHQKSKTNIPLHFEGGQARMVKKYPLLRGKGKNKSVKQMTVVIALETLDKFRDGATVDAETLVNMKLLSDKNSPVKVLRKGKITKKLTVKIPVSQPVKKLIEKAGGKVI